MGDTTGKQRDDTSSHAGRWIDAGSDGCADFSEGSLDQSMLCVDMGYVGVCPRCQSSWLYRFTCIMTFYNNKGISLLCCLHLYEHNEVHRIVGSTMSNQV